LHITSLVFTDEVPQIAFYGMGSISNKSLLELKNHYNKEPETIYPLITTNMFSPVNIIKSVHQRKNIYWKYVNILMSYITENKFDQQKILALRNYLVSIKCNSSIKTITNEHSGLTYIAKNIQPRLIFILDWRFEFEKWLKNEFGQDKDKIFKMNFAHIEGTKTDILQIPHPLDVKHHIYWHKTLPQILGRLIISKDITI